MNTHTQTGNKLRSSRNQAHAHKEHGPDTKKEEEDRREGECESGEEEETVAEVAAIDAWQLILIHVAAPAHAHTSSSYLCRHW